MTTRPQGDRLLFCDLEPFKMIPQQPMWSQMKIVISCITFDQVVYPKLSQLTKSLAASNYSFCKLWL